MDECGTNQLQEYGGKENIKIHYAMIEKGKRELIIC